MGATTLGKLFTPNVSLFTKHYNLVPCEGLHAKARIGIGSNGELEYCRAVLKRFCRIAKNRDINHLLYFYSKGNCNRDLPSTNPQCQSVALLVCAQLSCSRFPGCVVYIHFTGIGCVSLSAISVTLIQSTCGRRCRFALGHRDNVYHRFMPPIFISWGETFSYKTINF